MKRPINHVVQEWIVPRFHHRMNARQLKWCSDLDWSEPQWPYRIGPLNWLMAKPWTWDYRKLYESERKVWVVKRTATGPSTPPPFVYGGHGRLRAAWLAVTFPHVHHPDEE